MRGTRCRKGRTRYRKKNVVLTQCVNYYCGNLIKSVVIFSDFDCAQSDKFAMLACTLFFLLHIK